MLRFHAHLYRSVYLDAALLIPSRSTGIYSSVVVEQLPMNDLTKKNSCPLTKVSSHSYRLASAPGGRVAGIQESTKSYDPSTDHTSAIGHRVALHVPRS